MTLDVLCTDASDWLAAHPALYIAIGLLILPLAHLPLRTMLWWLRYASDVPPEREDKDVGVPPFIVGTFERVLAFGLALYGVHEALTLLAAWLGAKLAASWQRFEVKTDEAGRRVRVGTLLALIAGVISVAIGYLAGALVRDAVCLSGDSSLKAAIRCDGSMPRQAIPN
jgi:hypothetical protein